jgi:glycosyltransferase involved in cell wall biosynthesis
MNSKTITVLIPTFQRAKLLKRAIDSVLSQTYQNFEIIVCDNASQDQTFQIVENLRSRDSRIKYFRHTENIGMNKNFTFAVSKVRTPFFCFLSDDDYYLPTFFSDAMEGFEKSSKVKFSVLAAPTVDTEGKFLSNQLDSWPRTNCIYAPGDGLLPTLNGFHPIITTCIFRTEIIDEFSFDEEFKIMTDIPVLISCVAKYYFYVSDKVGGYFIRHPKAVGYTVVGIRESCRLWRKLELYFAKDKDISNKSLGIISKTLKKRNDKAFWGTFLMSFKRKDWAKFYCLSKILLRENYFIYKIPCLMLVLLSRSVIGVAMLIKLYQFFTFAWLKFRENCRRN